MRSRIREDVAAMARRDPAARGLLEVLLCYPGLHAVWLHRLAHALWESGFALPARLLSHATRFLTGIEIHPGAELGRRCTIDHGAGIVIGETAEVGDDVHMYHGITLGGDSPEPEKRHPTVEDGAVVGANATLIGDITVGEGAKVGAGAVVVESVPAGATVVGNPAQVVGRSSEPASAEDDGAASPSDDAARPADDPRTTREPPAESDAPWGARPESGVRSESNAASGEADSTPDEADSAACCSDGGVEAETEK